MNRLKAHISIRFLINVAILLILQVILAGQLLVEGRFEWYFQDVFSINLLRMRPVQAIALVTLILLVLNYLPLARNRLLHQFSWSALEHGKRFRVVVMAAVLIMTWAFASYGYNYYYNQAHYLDRLSLVVLAILVYVNPLFAIPFTMVCYLISYQFMFPIGFAYTDKQMLFEFLALFGVFVAVRPVTRGRTMDFVFVGMCMIGAYYYFPGIEKLHIGAGSPINWVFDNDLQQYVIFSYEKGWLAFRSQELVYSIADFMAVFRVPAQIFTVIIEVGGIFLLVRRRITVVFLIGAIMLHTGIMLASGVFFWKWIVLDGAMAWFIWRYGDSDEIKQIFNPVSTMLGIMIIASGVLFFDVIHLGWFNSPIHNYYKFEVIDTEGDSYDFAYSYLQPYDFPITQNRLHFVSPYPSITAVNGSINDPNIYAQSRFQTRDTVEDFITANSTDSFDEKKAEQLRDLLRVYAYNINTNRQSLFLPALIQPPLHINSQPFPDAYNFEHPIAEVKIHAITSFYDGDTVYTLQDVVTDTMPITIPEDLLN